MRAAAKAYLANPSVAYVEPNYIVRATATTPNDPRYGELWGMVRIRAPEMWDLFRGSTTIVVGVLDSGIRATHEDLAGNMTTNAFEIPGNGIDDDGNGYVDDVSGWDFAMDDNNPSDVNGHGTHCSGTIGGVGNNLVGVAGVNWSVGLMGLRFLGDDGSGNTADAVDAVLYAARNSGRLGIKLTSNSWGGGGYSQALYDAIALSGLSNQLFIAAAGNSGTDNDVTPHYPSNYNLPNIISVAAIAQSGALAGFSCYGATTVDIAAPGVNILSTYVGPVYQPLQGTSMATPHVSGAAALLWSIAPEAPYAVIRDAILQGARPNPALTGRMTTGAELDLMGALAYMGARLDLDRRGYRSDATVGVRISDSLVTNVATAVGFDVLVEQFVDPVWMPRWATNGILADRETSLTFTGAVTLVSGVTAVHGDRLTVNYAYTNLTGIATNASVTVFIDDVAPVITNARISQVTDDSARVAWWTDEPADSRALAATFIPLAGQPEIGTAGVYVDVPTTNVAGGVTNIYYEHAVDVTGLTPSTPYFAAVISADFAGNEASKPTNLASLAAGDYLRFVTRVRQTVYVNDMDHGLAGWFAYNLTNAFYSGEVWQFGAPAYGPSAPATGSNCWGTVLAGRYPALARAAVESPPIAVRDGPRLTFMQWYKFDLYSADYGQVEVNDGSGWTEVTALSTVGLPYVAGESSEWHRVTVDLSSFANRTLRIRFRVETDAEFQDAGWYVDDVMVSDLSPLGPAVVRTEVDDTLGGDGDGQPEAGETFILRFHIMNADLDYAYTSVAANVSCPVTGVRVGAAGSTVATYGTLDQQSFTNSGNQVQVTVDPGVADGTLATFFHHMTATNANGPWSSSEAFTMEIGRRESIRGTVTDRLSAAPVAGAAVTGRYGWYPNLVATTDVAGAYVLHGGRPGLPYEVTAGKTGEYSVSAPRIAAPPATGIDIALGKAWAGSSPATLDFVMEVNDSAVQFVTMSNTNAPYPDAFVYRATVRFPPGSPTTWLSLSTRQGSVPAGVTTNALAVTVDTTGLDPFIYTAEIVIDGNDVSGLPVVIPVTLTVGASPILNLLSVALAGGTHDGDPFVEPGETPELDLVLANRGSDTAYNVAGGLVYEGATAGVAVTVPGATWPDIGESDRASPQAPMPRISVGPGVADGAVLPFRLNVTADVGRAWSFPFSLTCSVRRTISGLVTGTNGVTPVAGAVVTAVSTNPALTMSGTSDALGAYRIDGLVNASYTVRCVPPVPFSSPPVQGVAVAGADVGGINFQVANWGMTVAPVALDAVVAEGMETNLPLVVSNSGPISGSVDFEVRLVQGISTEGWDAFRPPAAPWAQLVEGRDCVAGRLLVRFAAASDNVARVRALGTVSARTIRTFGVLPASMVEVADMPLQEAAARLAADPAVAYVEPDYLGSWMRLPDDTRFPEMYGLRNVRQTGGTLGADIGAETAWNLTTGSRSVVVAVCDSGVDLTHPDLVANLVPGFDFADWDADPSPGGEAHGTHVAGTIGAVGNNAIGVCGVNWEVSIMPLKIGDTGVSMSAAIGAILHSVSNNVPISNHSWGGPFFSGVLYEAIRTAWTNGHLLVCAAGNSAENVDLHPGYPAAYNLPNIISVAAVDRHDQLAGFSCFGVENVDLAAPGVDILSTWWPVAEMAYNSISGTSMATPQVAGAAALLKAAAPDATWDTIKLALLNGARRNPALTGKVLSGGSLDVGRAMQYFRPTWIVPNPSTMNVPSGGSATNRVAINAGGRLTAGTYRADLLVRQGLNSITVPVSLEVQSGPVPAHVSTAVSDASLGDGDSRAEPGETVDLVVRLVNNGSGLWLSPTGTLSSAVAGVTVVQPAGSWVTLASAEAADSTPFRVTFAPGVTNRVAFSLLVRGAGSGPWTLTFEIDVASLQSITGFVRDLASAAPIAGAAVECWGAAGGRTTTDTTGFYRFDGLLPGDYRVRAMPSTHERSAPAARTIVAADVTADFALRKPSPGLSSTNLVLSAQRELTAQTVLQVTNASADTFEFDALVLPLRRVALISDGDQMQPLEAPLKALGFRVTLLTNNLRTVVDAAFVQYTDDDEVIFAHDIVIADLTGKGGAGRLLGAGEYDVLTRYLDRGGRLLLTGGNPLSRPDDLHKMMLVGSDSMDRATEESVEAAAETVLPTTVFSALAVGERVEVEGLAYDLADPSTNEAVVRYLSADGASKLMRRVTPEGGVAYLWSGNSGVAEWLQRGVLRDVLKDLLVGEAQAPVPWLTVIPAATTVASGQVPVTIRADAAGLSSGRYEASVVIVGNYPGVENRAVRVTFDVVDPAIRTKSTTGVRDWMNRPLPGNGSPTSSMFQVLYAGGNGAIDPPSENGAAGGDDILLYQTAGAGVLGRIGKGYEALPQGRFDEAFRVLDGLTPASLSKSVYVRAWDGPSVAASVAYGDSVLHALQFTASESHDFGTWTVNVVPGYPSDDRPYRDTNGDSVPDGWYVANGLDARLPIGPLRPTGTPISSFGSYGAGNGQLYNPSGVVLGSNHVYVLDTLNSRIAVFDRNTHAWAFNYGQGGTANGRFASPSGIARHPTLNRIAVADTLNSRIQVFTFDGTGALTHERSIGTYGAGNGQFNKPGGIAIDAAGRMIVADTDNHRIQILNSTGGFVQAFGSLGAGSGQFNKPAGVGVYPGGQIVVADGGNNRIQSFGGTGGWIWSLGAFGTNNAQFKRPCGVQIGVQNRIFVSDTDNHRVQVFSSTRAHLLTFGGFGALPGQLKFPQGLMPVPDSPRLYVADTYNSRVQLFDTIIDGDGDGMDDLWEAANGLDPTLNDALGDAEGDGLLNIGEYRARRNPWAWDTDGDGTTDLESLGGGIDPFEVTREALTGGPGSILEWLARAGRQYRVQWSTNLIEGIWSDIPGSGFTAGVTDWIRVTNPVPTSATGVFYRPVEQRP
jgi:subtilisin family serine protease/sugar lactone lactonase YvrE/protocatechuate 3,4-dioxygenase beta subunit